MKTLDVGVVSGSSEPLVIYRWDGRIEGFYADYISLFSKALNIPIHLRIFNNRQQAQLALQRGDIQLLVHSAWSLAPRTSNESLPVLLQPQIMVVQKENVSQALSQMNILVMPDEPRQIVDRLRKIFHHVSIARSLRQALQQVQYGNADGFIGPQAQITYLLTFRPEIDLTYRRDLPSVIRESNFIARPNDAIIPQLNQVIKTIPSPLRDEIFNRWMSGIMLNNENKPPLLSEKDRTWITHHPVVDVVVMSNSPPYSYKNKNGQITGMDIDFLQLIGEKIGISFNFITAESPEDVINALKTGRAKITPSLVSTAARKRWLTFSHPYGSLEWVMITRNDRNAPTTLRQLAHRRVSLERGHALRDILQRETDVINTRSAEESMDRLMSGAVDATFDDYLDANFLQVTRYGNKIAIHPLTPPGAIPVLWDQFSAPKEHSELISIIDKTLDSLSPEEVRILHLKWVSAANFSVTDNGHISRWVAVSGGTLLIIAISSIFWGCWLVSQIKRRKEIEGSLQNSLAYWELLFNTIPTPMFVCDAAMNITAANSWFVQGMGDPPDRTFIGQGLLSSIVCSPTDQQVIRVNFFNCLAGKATYFADHIISVQGCQREVYLWLERYHDAKGAAHGVIGGWFDITERKMLSRELCAERDKAERASQEKSRFLACMSHEIRTALYIVIGILELEVNQRSENEPLHTAHCAATSLLGVIGDVLEFSRIESGMITLNYQPAMLPVVLEKCARPFSRIAMDKGLSFELKMKLSRTEYYLLDITRITQIINNLLSNAIKFTNKGGIIFSASVKEDETHRTSQLCLQIIDTGCGIPEDMFRSILLPYVQVEEERWGGTGTGLGLPISAQLATLMGGKLTLAAASGGGTLAQVNLPLQYSDEPVQSQYRQSSEAFLLTEALSILLVDDLPANLQVLSLQLASSQHWVMTAGSAEQALSFLDEYYFDVVLTDCQMPTMNGYELAKVIRHRTSLKKLPPPVILGCTANAFSSEQTQCIAAGMNGVLIKPLTQNHLLGEISRYYQLNNRQKVPFFDEIQKMAGGDERRENLLLQTILDGVEQDIAQIRNAIQTAADWDRISQLVHRMKGGFALLRYQPALRVCWRIEKGGRRCCDARHLETLLHYADIFYASVERHRADVCGVISH